MLTEYPNVREDFPRFTKGDNVDFHKRLQEAYCVINYNSNPGIEAVMAGIPVMVDEIDKGIPWRRIKKHLSPNHLTNQWSFI